MKSLTIVLSILFAALPTLASTPVLSERKLTDPQVEALKNYSLELIDASIFGNCGKVRTFVLDYAPQAPQKMIEGLMEDRLVETIGTDQYSNDTEGIRKAIAQVIPNPEANLEAARQFERLVFASVHSRDGFEIYGGVAAGAFELSLGTLAIFDRSNGEVLLIQEGYCE